MPSSVLDLIIRSRKTGKGAKEAETGLNKLTKAAQLAAVAGFAVLTAAAVKFLKSSIDITSQMEEMRSKFNVVFGNEASRAAAFVDELANRLGRSRLELTRMAASLQDTFVPMGLTRDAAADLSLQLTELAVDVGSFNDVATGDVARDFQSALVGNTETVRKYGIVITEANTKQKAYELGIAAVGAELTDQQKLLTRVQQIMAGTADAQGDAERTADSLANTQRRLAAEMENLQLIIGTGLTPALADLLGFVADTIHGGVEFAGALQLLDDQIRTRTIGGFILMKDGSLLTKSALIEMAAATREAQEAQRAEVFEKAAGAVDGWAASLIGAAGGAGELEEKTKGALEALEEYSEKALFLQTVNLQLREAMRDGVIDPTEIGRIQLLADAVGQELPPGLQETVGLFNRLSREGIDPATASADELRRALLNIPETVDVDIRLNQIVTGGGGGGPVPPTGTGGGAPAGGSNAGLTAADIEGQHGIEGIVPPGFNRDNFMIGTSSGEHFKVTPAPQVRSMEFGRGMTVNVFGQDDETIFLEKLRRAAGKL